MPNFCLVLCKNFTLIAVFYLSARDLLSVQITQQLHSGSFLKMSSDDGSIRSSSSSVLVIENKRADTSSKVSSLTSASQTKKQYSDVYAYIKEDMNDGTDLTLI